MDIYNYFLFFMLIVMTYYDIKKMYIPNYLIGGLWIGFGIAQPAYTTVAIILVGLILLINHLAIKIQSKEVLGWADVLVLPVVFSWFWAIFGYNNAFMAVALSFAVGTMMAYAYKKPIPFIAYFSIIYIFLFLFL